ncbi:MAG: SulP family inorganic anion transporter [Acidimicrobiia bacterium]
MKLPRLGLQRETLSEDAVAGVVLGVQSVPDGLAGGLLASVNPVYGLYAYMVGTFTGAIFTSSAFMAVQATGAMAMVITDVGPVHGSDDPGGTLFMLSILTGLVMLGLGLLKMGSILRFVSNAVMVGFLNAVGVNIILGQLDSFTGYEAEGGNRVLRAFDTLFNLGQAHWPTILIGLSTIVLIVLLEKTRLGSLGMVVAIVVTSAAVVVFSADGVQQLKDIVSIPNSLPLPVMPRFGAIPGLIIPAFALAFVGLVQGAGISGNFPNPDGNYPDASRDFIGQGAANVAAGVLQGMPVGGSMSATSLVTAAGARSRQALFIAGIVMGILIVVFAGVVEFIAMPALAGLLMLVGYRTIKPDNLISVWKTGQIQAVVLGVTFVLTMIIPLQNAVLVGVGISIILYVVRQSNDVAMKRWVLDQDGTVLEQDPPATIEPNDVLVLMPYGSLFFAAAPILEKELPRVTSDSTNAVVILRMRGRNDLGTTFMDVLRRYAQSLAAVGGKMMIVSATERIQHQLQVTGVTAVVGEENIYPTDERLGATVRRAYADAQSWVAANLESDDS